MVAGELCTGARRIDNVRHNVKHACTRIDSLWRILAEAVIYHGELCTWNVKLRYLWLPCEVHGLAALNGW